MAGPRKADHHSRDLMLKYRSVCLEENVHGRHRNVLGYSASSARTTAAKPAADPYDLSARREMNDLLRKCFLQAAKTDQITKQLRLGMPSKGSRIYAECIRPCRPVGTYIDVKRSTFGCLKGFFEDLETQGYIELKYSAPDPVVAKFFWNHPDIVSFKPWPLTTTVLGSSEDWVSLGDVSQEGWSEAPCNLSSPSSQSPLAATVRESRDARQTKKGAKGLNGRNRLPSAEDTLPNESSKPQASCYSSEMADMISCLPAGLLDDPPAQDADPPMAWIVEDSPSSNAPVQLEYKASVPRHTNASKSHSYQSYPTCVPEGLCREVVSRVPSPARVRRQRRQW
eukprot:TRINITY_DN12237_c0_g2_i1.p1 TRINITY_DN12237_c0_g2~~TRINITY_DN12237_c0_g2_i1.p1  ORF type:complete len:339 (-),score=44.18 TRINITY_DN12237_c0_g2_i1:163-1179(-)